MVSKRKYTNMKIIFLDLDGTLLTTEKTVSPGNLAALRRAAERGAHVVPCTGRAFSELPQAIQEQSFFRYAVTINGAQIYDGWEKKVLHRAEIPLEAALALVDRLRELPVLLDCYVDGKDYTSRQDYSRIDEFITEPALNRIIRRLRRPVENLRDFLVQNGRPVQKVQVFFQDETRQRRELERLAAELPGMSVTSSIPGNIEINDGAATKGEGLRFLCRHLGVPLEASMACGDGLNDLDMLRAAGVGVAMGNACREALEAADYVTDTNDRDGVAKAVERFCLGGEEV